MSVTINLSFTTAEVAALIAATYDELRLYRGAWAAGRVGVKFDYNNGAEIKKWTLVAGTVTYSYEDTAGHADSVYEWAPYDLGGPTLGEVRPAFEPTAVRMVSLLVGLSQMLDPLHFLYSSITGATDADTFADSKVADPNDFYNNRYLIFATGARKHEWSQVEDWTQSGAVWEMWQALTGAPGAGDEYFTLPFRPDAAMLAVQRAVADMWPRRAREVEDSSLTVLASGEQLYSVPPPIEVVESVAYLPSDDSVREDLPFERMQGGRFRLMGWPGSGTTLYVTGLAPLSIPYHLDAVTELAHPRDTGELLWRAEFYLRSDPNSGLNRDADRLKVLAGLIAGAGAGRGTPREYQIAQAIG